METIIISACISTVISYFLMNLNNVLVQEKIEKILEEMSRTHNDFMKEVFMENKKYLEAVKVEYTKSNNEQKSEIEQIAKRKIQK